MALRIFAIAILLFLAEIVFLTTKDFKDYQNEKNDIDFTDIAFENINGYLITKDGLEAKLDASRLLKWGDRSQLFDAQALFLHQNRQNSISANEVLLEEDTMYFSGDVHYENNESLDIKSQTLVYNTKTEVLDSTMPFKLTSMQGDVNGDSFVYEQKEGIIRIKKVKYTSFENESLP